MSVLRIPYVQSSQSFLLTLILDWVILGVWWFFFQQRRLGPKIPEGSTYASIGFKQIGLALREVLSLPQTFVYFVAYFLLADGLNTTGQYGVRKIEY